MTDLKQSIVLCIATLLALTPSAVNALSAILYPQLSGRCSSFKNYNDGSYDYICGARTGSIEAESDGIYRVTMYTDFPKDSIPKEKTRPKSGEYYEWTGFSHLRLDKDGCLQPVDKNEAGAFITSNECPPTPYPISAAEAPDITNPYYLVEKSRQKPNPGGTQSFLQPDFNNAELSSDTFAFTEIIDNNIVADAPFSGSDAGFLGPVVANQVAEAPFVDDTFFGWGAPTINVERKLKQRRGIKRRTSLVRAVGDMT